MKIVLIVVVVAAILYFFYKKGKQTASVLKIADLTQVKVETVEGELRIVDVVSIFKSQNLDPNVHTPFVAGNLTGFNVKPEGFLNKPGYVPLVMGVYNEGKEEIQFMEVVFAKSFDKGLQKVLENATNDNPLVVLS